MVDYTTQTWYDAEASLEENKQAFLDWRLSLNLDALTGTQIADVFRVELQLDKDIQEHNDKKAAFYAARQDALDAFNAQKQSELQALAQIWQDGEDNDYTVPQ